MKREEKRKQLWRTIVLTICFILLPGNVKASEEQDHMTTELTEDLDFRELDQFADAIIQMNQDMITISTKFLRIMEMERYHDT